MRKSRIVEIDSDNVQSFSLYTELKNGGLIVKRVHVRKRDGKIIRRTFNFYKSEEEFYFDGEPNYIYDRGEYL